PDHAHKAERVGRAMRVVSVQMRDFRSYARAEAVLGEGLTVVHGPNGAGKSNMLEALYFGCTGRSSRTRSERELVRFGARIARVVIKLAEGSQTHELSVGFGTPAGHGGPVKRMSADGAPVERLLDVEQRPLVSVFEPDRMELIKGPRAAQLGCRGEARLAYRPRSDAGGEEEFVAELQQRLAGDLERGYTSHGPHRDELRILRDERELRSFGSQGEQRLALLALLLAE